MITIFEAILISVISILGYVVIKAYYQTYIKK
jgi:hypothetical protein